MPLSLQNKKIIISAGASGIGWAIAKVCLSRGAIVYLCDIDVKSLNKIPRVSRSRRIILTRKMFRRYIFCWLYQMVFQF